MTAPLAADRSSPGTRADRGDLLVKLAVGLGAIIVAWHIFAIVCYNAPTNAIRLRLTPVLGRYINPVFDQAWNFFAPNPVDRDTEALYRVRYRGPDGHLVVSSWVSLTGTMNATVNSNWFSPYMFVRTTIIGGLQGFSGERFRYERALRQPAQRATGLLRDQSFDVIGLERSAMALAERGLPANRAYQIQLATVAVQYPRFSHRRQVRDDHAAAHTVYVKLPWIAGERVAEFEE